MTRLVVEDETPAQYYRYYLTTASWQRKRQAALKAAGDRCQKCGTTQRLQVHHLSYDRVGQERLDDLQVLCRGCHELTHGRLPTPTRGVEHIRLILPRVMERLFDDEAG